MTIPIDLSRVDKDLRDLGRIGETPEGGVSRRVFTPADQEGRRFILKRMQEAHLETWIDPAGNIHGRRRGRKMDGPPVGTGSHSDTVENGGKFDGAVGIIGAVEVMRALDEAGIETDAPLEMISFLGEEPNRFGLATFGSRILSGKLTDPKVLERLDPDGLTLRQALLDQGINPERIFEARQFPGRMKAFIELHVELGNVLHQAKIPIGIVTDIVSSYRYRVQFQGRADHSGTTPMNSRKDALAAAAEAILAVERICQAYSDRDILGTVGVIRSRPGMVNIVPAEAEIVMELRGRAHFSKREPAGKIRQEIEEMGRRRGIGISVETLLEEEAPVAAPRMIEAIRQCAEKLEYPYLLLPSRAGHDAMHMIHITDGGMIFIPSRDGIGHHPREWTAMADIGRGISLLAETLVALAQES